MTRPSRARRLAAALAVSVAVVFPAAALSQGGGADSGGTGPAAGDEPALEKQGTQGAGQAQTGGKAHSDGGEAQKKGKGEPEEQAETLDPDAPPELAARAWILVDPRDGEVLASQNEDIPRPVASTTKLMTAYVALQKLSPKKVLTAAPYNASAAESLLGLQPGEQMTVKDLLYGLILRSGNDAAVTLATGTSGSVPSFVRQMNKQAEALGLANTSYANPVGLDSPQNYSTAQDLATLTTELLKDPLFAKVAGSATATLRSGNTVREITTRNTLLNLDPTADGVKTGHTIGAGYVLVGSATRNGTQLVSAVLGARSEAARDAETEKLLDWGFAQYKASTPVKRGEELADPKLDYRDDTLPLLAKRAIEVSARKGQPVETRVNAPDEVSGAVEEGEPVGKVIVTVDGRKADAVPLIASRSVPAATLGDKIKSYLFSPVGLAIIALAVIVIVLLARSARRRRRGAGVRFAPRRDGGDPGPAPTAAQPVSPKQPAPTTEPKQPRQKRQRRRRKEPPPERTPEERRKMAEERMRRRRQRSGDGS